MSDLEQLIEQLVRSGKVPPDLMRMLTDSLNDPEKLTQVLAKLRAVVGPVAEDALNIEDFYDEGDGRKFTLLWPLSRENPLVARDIPFDTLDRKTQFFTLFAEWQRRETDGLSAMSGDLGGAEAIFLECLERAEQLGVGELQARTYENLARVCERRGDPQGVRTWLNRAEEARSAE
jgi:hypothetical protein